MSTTKPTFSPVALGALFAVCCGCVEDSRTDDDQHILDADDDEDSGTGKDTDSDSDSDADMDVDTDSDDSQDSDTGQDTGSDTSAGCNATGDGYWDSGSASIECEVFELTNYHRINGTDCPGGRQYEPAAPFEMHPLLQKAARDYSSAMASNGTCGHYSDGMTPQQRVAVTGYEASTGAENVACDQNTASDVVASWMGSSTHCPNIMNPKFIHIGIGYSKSGTTYWVQEFASPI